VFIVPQPDAIYAGILLEENKTADVFVVLYVNIVQYGIQGKREKRVGLALRAENMRSSRELPLKEVVKKYKQVKRTQ
jgi:hypothetical protein